jgi:hypothetical protein
MNDLEVHAILKWRIREFQLLYKTIKKVPIKWRNSDPYNCTSLIGLLEKNTVYVSDHSQVLTKANWKPVEKLFLAFTILFQYTRVNESAPITSSRGTRIYIGYRLQFIWR